MTAEKPTDKPACEKTLKQERLAKALRENLLKRKQQQRQRSKPEQDIPPSPGSER